MFVFPKTGNQVRNWSRVVTGKKTLTVWRVNGKYNM